MLKEILSILRRLTSKEHIEQEDLKALTINLLANIVVDQQRLIKKYNI